MSYILDALRKADAERERDPARGIHAQPAALQPGGAGSLGPRRLWLAGLVVMTVAGAGFVLFRPTAPAAPATPVAAPVPPPPAPVVAAAPPPVNIPAAEVQPPAPPMPAPVAAPAATPRPAPAPVAAAPAPAAPTALPSSAPAATDRIVPFAELPPEVQRELPKLAIHGGVHSENAAQRMLIVGGQVMHEGAELAPGVVLEQIRPKAAVLRFRGWRYTLPY
jgi:general secretion pathway protein B